MCVSSVCVCEARECEARECVCHKVNNSFKNFAPEIRFQLTFNETWLSTDTTLLLHGTERLFH